MTLVPVASLYTPMLATIVCSAAADWSKISPANQKLWKKFDPEIDETMWNSIGGVFKRKGDPDKEWGKVRESHLMPLH